VLTAMQKKVFIFFFNYFYCRGDPLTRVLATEIQNIQIADGDICRGLGVPVYMVFPRLFVSVPQNHHISFILNRFECVIDMCNSSSKNVQD
jgi:hypothetical protein